MDMGCHRAPSRVVFLRTVRPIAYRDRLQSRAWAALHPTRVARRSARNRRLGRGQKLGPSVIAALSLSLLVLAGREQVMEDIPDATRIAQTFAEQKRPSGWGLPEQFREIENQRLACLHKRCLMHS
jgi:hypothetical protein